MNNKEGDIWIKIIIITIWTTKTSIKMKTVPTSMQMAKAVSAQCQFWKCFGYIMLNSRIFRRAVFKWNQPSTKTTRGLITHLTNKFHEHFPLIQKLLCRIGLVFFCLCQRYFHGIYKFDSLKYDKDCLEERIFLTVVNVNFDSFALRYYRPCLVDKISKKCHLIF